MNFNEFAFCSKNKIKDVTVETSLDSSPYFLIKRCFFKQKFNKYQTNFFYTSIFNNFTSLLNAICNFSNFDGIIELTIFMKYLLKFQLNFFF